jgi:dienelactone hydrolase
MSTPAGENPGEDSRRAGNLPVLLLHPWWGITPAVNKWTADLATAGRRVRLPDLYAGPSRVSCRSGPSRSACAGTGASP